MNVETVLLAICFPKKRNGIGIIQEIKVWLPVFAILTQFDRIFYVYEKQPFIGEVHELTVEFGDDILTIFPINKYFLRRV